MARAGSLALAVFGCVFLCVSGAVAQTSAPNTQDSVLSGTNFAAVGAIIYLQPEVWTNPELASKAQRVCADFPNIAAQINSTAPDRGLMSGLAFSANTWQQWGKFATMPKGLFDFPGYTGPDGWPTMVRTGGDLFIHAKAIRRDAVYQLVIDFVDNLGPEIVAKVDDIDAWKYSLDNSNRDLTGFVDGSHNSPDDERAQWGLIGREDPVHVGGSFAIGQRWLHNLQAFNALRTGDQENVFGRTKGDSVELPKPFIDSHVARANQTGFGFFIVRQAMPWGSPANGQNGLFFIAYTADAHRLDKLCASMVGLGTDSTPANHFDLIMKFSTPVASNFWFFPSKSILATLATKGTMAISAQ